MTSHPQLDRLVELGVHDLAGLSATAFADLTHALPEEPGTVLAVHPDLVPASRLAPLLAHRGRPGFVVTDLTDLDLFAPVRGVEVPDRPLYLLHEVDRGDDLRNLSPDEALPVLEARGRSPLTVSEGISWLLQEPKALEPNHCFMTIGSGRLTGRRLDARTPAIWISGGTGRDGAARRHAPKVGWCWAGNRHTWLGFASTRQRTATTTPDSP